MNSEPRMTGEATAWRLASVPGCDNTEPSAVEAWSVGSPKSLQYGAFCSANWTVCHRRHPVVPAPSTPTSAVPGEAD